MARIGFVGLGNMGRHMARNLRKAGHAVTAFDILPAALAEAAEAGMTVAASAAAAAQDADFVITMLPAGPQVRDAWLGAGAMAAGCAADAVLIDCSTIDVATAREVASAAGRPMLDAPVSGGVMGAEAGTLTFMVGGAEGAFGRAEPILKDMGRAVIHCGGPGAGQAAKICNNMMLAASMIVTSEAFVLAERLGLPAQSLFDVVSKSTGQSWALTGYCPVPRPVPASPANRGYQPGFAAALMAKDLGLAEAAARDTGTEIAVGGQAAALFRRYVEQGGGAADFSGIIRMIREG